MSGKIVSNVLGLVGAALGGALGFVLFWQLLRVNLYALILPGALLGLGCSLLARHRSQARGVVCGLAAVALALFTEWWFFPFGKDKSFGYFLGHIHELDRGVFAYAMIGVGALFAYWWGKDAHFAGKLTRVGRLE
jgi:hypothetical protein